jgi:diamine N-acetyltransferase
MKKDIYIHGNEIGLRSLSEKDIEMVRLWRNQDHIRKWFVYSNIISVEEQQRWYENYLKKPDDLMFIIENNVDGEGLLPVGAVALYNIDLIKKNAEFGRLMIGESSAAGKGIALKATALICGYGFKELNLKSIHLDVFPNNEKAVNIYKKIGFKQEIYDTEKSKLIKMTLSPASFCSFQTMTHRRKEC